MKEDEKHSFDKLKREMDYRFAKLEASVAALLSTPDGVQCGCKGSETYPIGAKNDINTGKKMRQARINATHPDEREHLPVECEGMETEGGGA